MRLKRYLIASFVSCFLASGISCAEVLTEPGASIKTVASIYGISIPVSEEQKRVVKNAESSEPLNYMLDIKLVEKNEYEPQEWIREILKSYGTVIYPIYVHFINRGNKKVDNYRGSVTIDFPPNIKNPSMFLVETNENVSEIDFKINKETNTISFNVNKNDCYFVLVDKIIKQKVKKTIKNTKTVNVNKKYLKSKPAGQKRTYDNYLTLGEALCSPWILISSLFWYDDSKKKHLNKAKRYRICKKGTRYNQHRYLKYKGVRYK